jgi:hypothetical protein
MKKVKFDNGQSIARQSALPGVTLTPAQRKPMKLEGWLVDDHVCIQKPGERGGWFVSLYPCGDKISFDFFTKADATEYAKDISKLGIDWATMFLPENYVKSAAYLKALTQLHALRDRYEADGYFKPRDDPS